MQFSCHQGAWLRQISPINNPLARGSSTNNITKERVAQKIIENPSDQVELGTT